MPVIFVLDIFRQFLGTTAYSLGVTNAVPMLKGVALRVAQGEEPGKGADGCQACIPRSDGMAALAFQVIEKPQDNGGVEVLKMQG